MEEEKQSKQLTKKERRELKRQQKKTARQKQMRQKRFKRVGLWSAIFLSVAAVIVAVRLNINSTPKQPVLPVDAVADSDHVKGGSESKALLIEYSDFQCPACGHYYSLIKQLNQEFGDQVQLVYRNFPLKQIHRNAEQAAFAAEAAGKQGKFWEMHDLIFEGQKDWSDEKNAKETFIIYAESLDLDIEAFKTDMGSEDIKNKVRNDYNSGIKIGVNSTPSFFLNGKKLHNPRSYEDLKKIVEESLIQ